MTPVVGVQRRDNLRAHRFHGRLSSEPARTGQARVSTAELIQPLDGGTFLIADVPSVKSAGMYASKCRFGSADQTPQWRAKPASAMIPMKRPDVAKLPTIPPKASR